MLFERYYKPLVLFARSFSPDTGYAEDLVQEVFCRFLEKKVYLRVEASALATYLFRAVRNGAINKARDERAITFQPVDTLTCDVIEEENITFDPEVVRDIVAAIDRLPGKTAFVVRAVLVERKRYKEVAALANVSVNTVKTLLLNGLHAIRQQFSSYQILLFITRRINS
jgi:RNA polymerase sigma-70 factor (ECF subfamily)